MKCPNKLCEHGIEGSPATCPRCSIPLPGGVLADRFSLEKIARTTPYSITYVAFDRERTVETQVRLYIPKFGRSASALKSEIKALKEMHFEGLARILHFDWDADYPWVAEDKIAGSSMVGRLVGRDRPLAEPELVGVLLEAARILEKLHTLHIFHRDIRPESLYNRDADNRLMLGSPGWEREFHDKTGTKNRSVYSAPESGSSRATAQADLYSLGVSALHLLTGLNPEGLYNANTRTFAWQRAVKVSPRLAEILDGLVAAAPGDRIQTAGRLVQLLQTIDRENGAPDLRGADEGGEAGRPGASPAVTSGGPKGRSAAGAPVAVAAGAAAAAAAMAGPAAADGTRTQADSRGGGNASWGGLRTAGPEEPGREKRLRRVVAAMAAALAALLGVIAALLRRVWESSLGHALGAHGAKILVALGLMSSAGVVGLQLKDKPAAPAKDRPAIQARAEGDRPGLPAPLVGYDDQAVPTDPDFHAIAQAQGPLPDPSLLGKWLDQQLAARERSLAAARAAQDRAAENHGGAGRGGENAAAEGPGRAAYGFAASPAAPDGFAFSDGSRRETSRTMSLYSSIFPWHGRQMALGSAQPGNPQLSELSAAQLLARHAGLPPSLAALDTSRQAADGPSGYGSASGGRGMAGVPASQAAAAATYAASSARNALSVAAGAAGDAVATLVPSETSQASEEAASREAGGPADGGGPDGARRSTQGLAAGSPYDKAAEPGYDPSDSSGLSQVVSPYFIRVNKTYRTLTLYREGQFAAQFPITIGQGPTTPDGRFTIANKVAKPPYESIPGGDPRNPLGAYWLGLDVSYPGGKAIGLHGTNDPGRLGQAESGGCIRLRNEDVQKIYDLVPTGTPVEII